MRALLIVIALAAVVTGCQFNEFAQVAKVAENIDDHRTGCEVDADALMTAYKQWEANRYHFDDDDPTPTPSPIDNSDLVTSVLLEKVWENGCATGRRDATNAEQATLAGLRDQLTILDEEIAALEPTATPTATPTN